MIRSLSPADDNFLRALSLIQARAERAQRQLATGLKITQASDDPDQLSNLMQARFEIEQLGQIGMNLARVKVEVDTGEQALQSAVKLIDRAIVLGLQGAGGTATDQTRSTLAIEVEGILEQITNLANSKVEGRYIFSGDSDSTAAFSYDPSDPDNPVGSYQGTEATRRLLHPAGTTFSVSQTAEEIFNPSGNSVLNALNELRIGLRDNDIARIDAGAAELRGASTHVNRSLAFYGSVQNRVSDGIEYVNKMQLRLQAEVAGIQEADITEAILEFQQAAFHQQAALSSKGSLPKTSLFDYLG